MNKIAKIIAVVTRRFYPRGTQRMLNMLFSPRKLLIEAVIKYDGNLFINIDTSSYVERELFFHGHYEKKVTDLFKGFIKEGCVAIDVGANIGSHTLIMGKLAGSTGRVIAFEPHPDIYKKLINNINLNNFANIKVFRLALSDKEGKANLFSYSEQMSDKGTSSLYEITNLQGKLEVDISTIDKIVRDEKMNRLDFIKIDTRGSDLPIIIGGSESIKKFKPSIVFEYNRDNWTYSGSKWEDMKRFFGQNNYSLYLIGQDDPTPIMEEPTLKTSHNILAIPVNRKNN